MDVERDECTPERLSDATLLGFEGEEKKADCCAVLETESSLKTVTRSTRLCFAPILKRKPTSAVASDCETKHKSLETLMSELEISEKWSVGKRASLRRMRRRKAKKKSVASKLAVEMKRFLSEEPLAGARYFLETAERFAELSTEGGTQQMCEALKCLDFAVRLWTAHWEASGKQKCVETDTLSMTEPMTGVSPVSVGTEMSEAQSHLGARIFEAKAQLCLELERDFEAIESALQSLRFGEWAPALLTLSRAEFNWGDFSQALATANRALALEPSSEELRGHIADVQSAVAAIGSDVRKDKGLGKRLFLRKERSKPGAKYVRRKPPPKSMKQAILKSSASYRMYYFVRNESIHRIFR